ASSREVTFSCKLRSRATVFRRSSRYSSVNPVPILCLARPIDAGLGVERLDQRVPTGDGVVQPGLEGPVPPPFEIIERHALLLDPGVVAKVEDALAVDPGKLEHVIVRDGLQVGSEDFARIDLAKAAGIMRGGIFLPLAGVHRGPI